MKLSAVVMALLSCTACASNAATQNELLGMSSLNIESIQSIMDRSAEAHTQSIAFGGLGDELLTVLPVLFFLVLGYVTARVCRSARFSFAPRAAVKTIKTVDDADEADAEVDTVCEEMVTEPTCAKPSSRHCNAQVRKRIRKASQTNPEKVEKVVLEVPPCHSPKECLESPPMVKETTPSSQEASPATQRMVKLMTKKAERKARKAAEQKVVEQSVKHESPSPLDNTEKSVSEVSLQVDETIAGQSLSMSPTLCGKSPSMLSSRSTLCESSASLTCSTPDLARSKSKDISECTIEEELAESCDPAANPADESDALQEAQGPIEDEVPGSIGGIGVCSDLAHINFDDIESDTDSDVEFDQQTASISMVDASQSCPDMANAPVMWCNPGVMDESMQIEGWMPVAVAIECAPAGAFDGLWTNGADEKILIEKLEIMFESGVSWDMEMHSVTSMSVTLKDQTFYAELDGSDMLADAQLLWSDGDVWTFHGRAQSSNEEEVPEVPCMMMQEMMMMPILNTPDEMQMLQVDCFQSEELMMHFPVSEQMQVPPNMQCMPANGQQWDTCWDWQKKGRCPRGSSCEWYHPEPEASLF